MKCKICDYEFEPSSAWIQVCSDFCRAKSKRAAQLRYAMTEGGVASRKRNSKISEKSERLRNWRIKNKERVNGYRRKWKLKNRWYDIHAAHLRRTRLKNNSESSWEMLFFPKEESERVKCMIKGWWNEIFHTCGYCDMVFAGKFHVDHIFPIAQGGPHCSWNIKLSCPPCNLRKGSKTPFQANMWPKPGQEFYRI